MKREGKEFGANCIAPMESISSCNEKVPMKHLKMPGEEHESREKALRVRPGNLAWGRSWNHLQWRRGPSKTVRLNDHTSGFAKHITRMGWTVNETGAWTV